MCKKSGNDDYTIYSYNNFKISMLELGFCSMIFLARFYRKWVPSKGGWFGGLHKPGAKEKILNELRWPSYSYFFFLIFWLGWAVARCSRPQRRLQSANADAGLEGGRGICLHLVIRLNTHSCTAFSDFTHKQTH